MIMPIGPTALKAERRTRFGYSDEAPKLLFIVNRLLARVDVKHFNLRFNPILAFRFGGETASSGLQLVNTRGVDIRFNIKNVVSGYLCLWY